MNECIKVSDRMPPEKDIIPNWNETTNDFDGMFYSISEIVPVTVEYKDGRSIKREVQYLRTINGEWDYEIRYYKQRVITWMERPEPYEGER